MAKQRVIMQKHIENNLTHSRNSEHYYEILFSIDCKESYLNEIISQVIADCILESGDGVEFLDKDMIEVKQ